TLFVPSPTVCNNRGTSEPSDSTPAASASGFAGPQPNLLVLLLLSTIALVFALSTVEDGLSEDVRTAARAPSPQGAGLTVGTGNLTRVGKLIRAQAILHALTRTSGVLSGIRTPWTLPDNFNIEDDQCALLPSQYATPGDPYSESPHS
ncbi:hypothetical protein L226DRAFT_561588, partial [Lentinus tigrinus ALCF2SS1-7]|uniref:uncharacterized protein n=1 Tax=Lentinus tigrinus ALCF2SS1-7 TaxID=1328758 RepID=UPI00116634FB